MDILWIVDAQKDFIEPDGKLTVDAPIKVRLNMQKTVSWANKNNLAVGYSQDWHEVQDKEISDSPDYESTYPEHCIAGSLGAELIPEISTAAILKGFFNVKKTVFDVWDKEYGGREELEKFIEKHNPDNIYVIGVATEVCVRFAVLGFLQRYKNTSVYVIEDAIWGISADKSNAAVDEMKQKGAKFIKYQDL